MYAKSKRLLDAVQRVLLLSSATVREIVQTGFCAQPKNLRKIRTVKAQTLLTFFLYGHFTSELDSIILVVPFQLRILWDSV